MWGMFGSLLIKEDDGVGMAVQLAQDALHARVTFAVTSSQPWARFGERLYHSQAYRYCYLAAAWLAILGLANFEEPRVYLPGEELSALAAGWVRALDVLWLLLVLGDLGLQVLYTGLATARTRGWLWLKGIVVVVLLGNLIANAAMGAPYVARALRPLLLLERMRNVRKIAATTAETVPRIVSVVVLLGLNLLGHSILGFLLFAGVETGNCKVVRRNNPPTNCSTMLYPPDTCDNYFATLGESTLHMFELLTAVNFPTVALPAMRCNPYSVLFFVSYVTVAVYLLFNLALAVAYTEFYLGMRAEVLVRFYRIFSGLDKAFTVLVAEQRGGATAVRSAAAAVVAWGERSPRGGSSSSSSSSSSGNRERGASSHRNSYVAWDEIIASYDKTPSGTLDCATFASFYRRLRPQLGEADGAQLSAALFNCFANTHSAAGGGGLGMDAHAFRRMMLLFGNVITKRDPTLVEVDDALTREENLEIEVFCSGPRPLDQRDQGSSAEGSSSSSSSTGEAGDAAAGKATPQVVKNPLAAAATATAAAVAATEPAAEATPAPKQPLPPTVLVVSSPASGGGSPPSTEGSPQAFPGGEGAAARSGSPVQGRRSRASSLLPALREALNFSRPSGLSSTTTALGSGRNASASSAGGGGYGAPRPSRLSWTGGASFSRAGSFAGEGSGSRALTRLMDIRRTHYMHASMAVNHGMGSSGSGSVNDGSSPDSPAGAAGAVGAAPPPAACRLACCSQASWNSLCEATLPVVESKAAAVVFDITTLTAGVFLLVQLSLETDEPGNPTEGATQLLNQLQFLTLFIGILYVTSRVLVWGSRRYWKRGALNRFDLVIIYTTTIGLLFGQLSGQEQWLGEVLTFLRILRLVRVFRFLPGFTSTILAFKDTLPLLGQHVLILLSSLYAFAIVGMYAFGGRLLRSNPAVAASSYGQYKYYDVMNFDTLPRAMFSQFYLLTINDWVVLMEGCVAAVGQSARLYFILFWPINVLFLLNVIIAFTTVAFGAEKDRRDAAMAAARAEAPEMLLRNHQERGAFLSSAVFTVGVLDWRQLLSQGGADVRGWLFMRRPRFNDVYDALFKDDVQKTFPETLGKEAWLKKDV